VAREHVARALPGALLLAQRRGPRDGPGELQAAVAEPRRVAQLLPDVGEPGHQPGRDAERGADLLDPLGGAQLGQLGYGLEAVALHVDGQRGCCHRTSPDGTHALVARCVVRGRRRAPAPGFRGASATPQSITAQSTIAGPPPAAARLGLRRNRARTTAAPVISVVRNMTSSSAVT